MATIEAHAITADTLKALQQLPPRRPADPPEPASVVRWERVAPDRYVVRDGNEVLGYVDVVGAVFVVLSGTRYDTATEFAQTLVFDSAIRALTAARRA